MDRNCRWKKVIIFYFIYFINVFKNFYLFVNKFFVFLYVYICKYFFYVYICRYLC